MGLDANGLPSPSLPSAMSQMSDLTLAHTDDQSLRPQPWSDLPCLSKSETELSTKHRQPVIAHRLSFDRWLKILGSKHGFGDKFLLHCAC